MFVISKKPNGEYKFVYASKKGTIIFTSIGCKQKIDCEQMIEGIKDNIASLNFTKNSTASGKYFFRLSIGGLVLATSRKFASEQSLQKGISGIIKYISRAETLDFSENQFVFGDTETITDQA
jgi:hypothetical protein